MSADEPPPAPRTPPGDAPGSVPDWTLEEASAYFAEGGIPIAAERLQLIIRGLQWKPVGQRRAPGVTGRGKPTYRVADLMRLHSAVAPWIAVQGPRSGWNPETGGPT